MTANIYDEAKPEQIIQQLIKWLSIDKKIHISIHYLSSALHDHNALHVLPENKVHYCHFCNAAKTTSKGLSMCLNNKRKSIQKALYLKKQYSGTCYLGISEIVTPVFIDTTPVCIIYIGNMVIHGHQTTLKSQIQSQCTMTGVNPQLLQQQLPHLAHVSPKTFQDYHELANILESTIQLYLTQTVQQKAPSLLSNDADKTHWIVNQTLDYIHQFYYSNLNLEDIAGLYFINPQYLSKLFTKQMGLSFTHYVNQVRIDHAKELLTLTQKSVTEIATLVGFNNITYFNRIFKKITNLTPTTYRHND